MAIVAQAEVVGNRVVFASNRGVFQVSAEFVTTFINPRNRTYRYSKETVINTFCHPAAELRQSVGRIRGSFVGKDRGIGNRARMSSRDHTIVSPQRKSGTVAESPQSRLDRGHAVKLRPFDPMQTLRLGSTDWNRSLSDSRNFKARANDHPPRLR